MPEGWPSGRLRPGPSAYSAALSSGTRCGRMSRMRMYAAAPARATRQIVADLLFVLWLVLWVWMAVTVHDTTMLLAGPGRQTEESATSLSEKLRDAGGSLDDLPLVGDGIATPFDEAADASDGIAAAGRAQVEAVEDLALLARSRGRGDPDPRGRGVLPAVALALRPPGQCRSAVRRRRRGPRPVRAPGPGPAAHARARQDQRRPRRRLAAAGPGHHPHPRRARAAGQRAAAAARARHSGDHGEGAQQAHRRDAPGGVRAR